MQMYNEAEQVGEIVALLSTAPSQSTLMLTLPLYRILLSGGQGRARCPFTEPSAFPYRLQVESGEQGAQLPSEADRFTGERGCKKIYLLIHKRISISLCRLSIDSLSQEDQLSLAAVHYLRSHFQEVSGSRSSAVEELALAKSRFEMSPHRSIFSLLPSSGHGHLQTSSVREP